MGRIQGVLVSPGIIYKCGCVPMHGFWRNDPECPLYIQRDLWPPKMKSHCSTPCSFTTEKGSSGERNTASAATLPYENSLSLASPSLLLLLLSHFSRVQLRATPWTAAHQAPQSLEFSRQEHWSGLPFPSPMHESEK